MDKIKNFLAHPITQLVGLQGVVAVITWIVTHRSSLPVWEIWLAILFGVGCSFWISNEVGTWKERHKKGLTKRPNKEVETTIREWINIPAWSVKPEELQEGTLFAYQVQHQDVHVAVVRQASEPSVVALFSKATMTSTKTTLTDVEWDRLAGQLSIEMARLGIQWDFVGTPNKYETIQLGEPVILDDELTGYSFRARIIFVVRARILVSEVWKEALRLSDNSKTKPPNAP